MGHLTKSGYFLPSKRFNIKLKTKRAIPPTIHIIVGRRIAYVG